MNICGFSNCDLSSSGPGVYVSIFVSGCSIHCKNCQNKEAWDYNYGVPFDDQYRQKVIDALSSPYVSGLSILGGEPLDPKNVDEVEKLCKDVRDKFHDTRKIWLWTGYKKEKIDKLPIIQYLDVVVSDPYIEAFNNGKTKYRGSSNQRVWWAKTGAPYDDEPLEDGHHQNQYKGDGTDTEQGKDTCHSRECCD